MMFGLTLMPVQRWLELGKRTLLHALQRHPRARIKKPTAADAVLACKAATSTQRHHVPDVWGACDGLKLAIQASVDNTAQNMFHNGWTHGHCTICLFVFALTPLDAGTICPNKCEQVFNEAGGKAVIDTVFSSGQKGCFIKSSQPADPMDAQELLMNQDAALVHQTSEWGMRQIQANFLLP
jgi:hypothetical protein